MKSHLLLVLVILLGFGLRLFHLDSAPKGALIDEAHFGYLAYSLLETGKDEHGTPYPIIFKGFGDQKLPAYAYLMMPVVKLFGLSTFSIRIPSMLAGTLLILVMYLIIMEIGLGKKWALLGALLTAISPWSFFLSRMGFESNVGLLFFAVGLWALLKVAHLSQLKTKKNEDLVKWWPIVGGVMWGLTWYAYIAFRPVTVLIAVLYFGILVVSKQMVWKKAAIFFISLAITVFPLFLPSAIESNTTRFNQVGVLSDRGISLEIDENRTFCDMQLPRLLCYVVWNKGTVISHLLIKRFVHTFSPQYLATEGEGGIIFLTVKNYGQFFFVLYPFFILGLLMLINPPKALRLSVPTKVLIALGLLITPLPTLLVGEAQKVRISSLFPFIAILIVIGVTTVYVFLKYKLLQRAFVALLVAAVLIDASFYFINYFTVHTVKNDFYYQTFLPDTFTYLNDYDRNTEIIIKPFFSDPLMFYAYYSKMDPRFYQENAVLGELEASGFQHTVKLANYIIKDDSLKNIACNAAKTGKPTVFVTNIKEDGGYKYVVYSLNGSMEYVFIYDIQRYLSRNPNLCEGT